MLLVVGVTRYDQDLSRVKFVREGYCEKDNVENDEAVARALQEEIWRIDCLEASGVFNGGPEHLQESVLAQNWLGPSGRHYIHGHGNDQQAANEPGIQMENAVPCGIIIKEASDHNRVENDVQPEIKMLASCSIPGGEKPSYVDDLLHIYNIADESSLDGEVGKRLNQMVPIPVSICEKDNVENDEAVARALQEEIWRIDCLEASGVFNGGPEHLQESVLAQNWLGPSGRHYIHGHGNDQQAANEPGIQMENAVPCGIIIKEASDHNRVENDVQPEIKMLASCSIPGGEKPSYVDDLLHIYNIADESSLDGEVGKRLNQMVPIPVSICEKDNVENDEAVARALQEEIWRIDCLEASGVFNGGPEHLQESVLAQNWLGSSGRHYSYGHDNDQQAANEPGIQIKNAVPYRIIIEEASDHNRVENDVQPEIKMLASCSIPGGEKPSYVDDLLHIFNIADESSLDGEVGKRLNQMVPIPHVPKTIEKIPTVDEEISDHQRLLERLQLYELVELKVQGDGNCQFRALSDQLYRSPDYHASVREQITRQVPEGLSKHVVSSKKAQANWYRKLLEAWRAAKPPPKTPEEAARLVIETLKRHQKADVEGLLAFYGLPLPHTLVQLTAEAPTSLPEGVEYEFQTFLVDPRAIADGDGMTVYVSTTDPRESSCVPIEVQVASVQRSQARAEKNYTEADAIHKKIIEFGYRILNQNNEETLARKYRIRLRGIDAPENEMPYGKEAKEELTKIVQGKCLRVLVCGIDQYGRYVADIYCNGKFVQELMLKKGFAWHYEAYDQRPELARWQKEARDKRVGLWASSNPEKPWEWRKNNKEKGQMRR
ncbi:uncharacterized protein LOC115955241 isoform X4 [Quercus lobata]|uniref:uncharacterized protein LOC115955241 isoform X4 n=1 Tax=Quercus lobata TaxID=97700 RepID=UPI001244E235|nr:uncharacterized protein LOC115955241 isoform X4 [Quercus lobata]